MGRGTQGRVPGSVARMCPAESAELWINVSRPATRAVERGPVLAAQGGPRRGLLISPFLARASPPYTKWLISLARPTGIEPVLPP
jgi:hypothetical protein